MIKVSANLNVAVGKREMIQELLEAEKEHLLKTGNTQLELVEAQLIDNNKILKELHKKVDSGIDFKTLFPNQQIVGFCAVIEALKRENKEIMEEVLLAEKLLNTVSIRSITIEKD